MKNLKSLMFIVLMIGISTFAAAQNTAKIIAVVNHANWCPACKANGERMKTEVFSKLNMSDVQIIVNDMSDKESTAKAEAELKKAGYLDAAKQEKGTGQILLIDPKTKKIVKKISVTKGSAEIIEAIQSTVKG